MDRALHQLPLVELRLVDVLYLALLPLALLRLREQLASLLELLLLNVAPDAVLLARAPLLLEALRLRRLICLHLRNLEVLRLLLLFLEQPLLLLLAPLDHHLSRQHPLMLLLNLRQNLCRRHARCRSRLERRSPLRRLGRDHRHRFLEALRQLRDVPLHPLALERLLADARHSVLVVEPHRQEAVTHSVNDDLFRLLEAEEGNELLERVNLDGVVHTAHLLKRAQRRNLLERRNVVRQLHLRHRRRSRDGARDRLELGEELLGALAKVERAKLSLEEVVKFLHLRVDECHHPLRLQVGEQGGAREHVALALVEREAEQRRHAVVALLLNLELKVVGAVLAVVGCHCERREHHGRRHEPDVRSHQALVEALGEVIELEPRVGVVDKVLRHMEHLGELGEIHRHELRLGRLLHEHHERVNVLHRSKRLLPELQLRRRLELLETRLHVELLRLRKHQVGAVALVAVLVEVAQVVAQDFAQPPELGGALVRRTELKRASRRHRVQSLELRVVAQNLEHRAVRLPEKLEPRRHQLSVRAVLTLV
mmetsp:Transcript_22922/g.74677  ORF Transcript_22922/g.74677 Transcript_22922/m.74677 type:complete len:539 (-) Transcript_22922:425-2041(-)